MPDFIINFSAQSNRRHLASEFPDTKEAKFVYDEVDEARHPNIAKVKGVYKEHYLVYELEGTRLDRLISKSKFIINDKFISECYRQLLRVFFEVTRFLMDTQIRWVANLENIYLLEEDGHFIFKFVGFKRGKKDAPSLCNEFSGLVRNINRQCGWNDEITHVEMNQFIIYLESRDINVLRNVAYLPITWNLIERRLFIMDMGDCLKDSYDDLINSGHEDVLANHMTKWHLGLSRALNSLKIVCDAYEARKALRKNRAQPADPHKPIFGLYFFRKSCSHFYETVVQELPDVDSVVYEFETAFPGLISGLAELARGSQFDFATSKRDFLEMLFKVK